MSFSEKKIFYTIVKSIAILFIAMLFSCKNDMKNIVKISEIETMPELSGENMYLEETVYGKKTLSVFTPELQKFSRENSQYDTPRTIFPEGIHVVHFSDFPDTLSMIRANYAILFEDTETWEAQGNVRAQNAKGELLQTEFLVWDQKNGVIFSTQQVQITTEDDVIFGYGFRSDDNFENWEIQQVTGVFSLEAD